MTIDCGVGLFMGVPMRTICSKELVLLNVYTLPPPLSSCIAVEKGATKERNPRRFPYYLRLCFYFTRSVTDRACEI